MKQMNKAAAFLTAVLLLAGCGTETAEPKEALNAHAHSGYTANGDLQEKTASLSVLPDFLHNKTEEMKAVYSAAAASRTLLESIPCYCGCGESAGHTSSYDCFVHENKENGAVVWDDHGTRCGVCLEIAAEAILQANEGVPIQEIRGHIDSKYADGYAKPTETPPPGA